MKLQEHLAAVGKLIRGWLPKGSILSSPRKMLRPWWWRPLWGYVIAAVVVSAIIDYFYQGFSVEMLGGIALVSVLIASSYYLRVRPIRRVNRVIWIWLGITPIGFFIFAILFISGIGGYFGNTLGGWFTLIDFIPFVIGAFIGNWIGKRRNYRLPMTP